jgi:hypothetical protein
MKIISNVMPIKSDWVTAACLIVKESTWDSGVFTSRDVAESFVKLRMSYTLNLLSDMVLNGGPLSRWSGAQELHCLVSSVSKVDVKDMFLTGAFHIDDWLRESRLSWIEGYTKYLEFLLSEGRASNFTFEPSTFLTAATIVCEQILPKKSDDKKKSDDNSAVAVVSDSPPAEESQSASSSGGSAATVCRTLYSVNTFSTPMGDTLRRAMVDKDFKSSDQFCFEIEAPILSKSVGTAFVKIFCNTIQAAIYKLAFTPKTAENSKFVELCLSPVAKGKAGATSSRLELRPDATTKKYPGIEFIFVGDVSVTPSPHSLRVCSLVQKGAGEDPPIIIDIFVKGDKHVSLSDVDDLCVVPAWMVKATIFADTHNSSMRTLVVVELADFEAGAAFAADEQIPHVRNHHWPPGCNARMLGAIGHPRVRQTTSLAMRPCPLSRWSWNWPHRAFCTTSLIVLPALLRRVLG